MLNETVISLNQIWLHDLQNGLVLAWHQSHSLQLIVGKLTSVRIPVEEDVPMWGDIHVGVHANWDSVDKDLPGSPGTVAWKLDIQLGGPKLAVGLADNDNIVSSCCVPRQLILSKVALVSGWYIGHVVDVVVVAPPLSVCRGVTHQGNTEKGQQTSHVSN